MTIDKDHKKLTDRWLRHIIKGDGPEKSEAGKFRYDGLVFYYEDSPSQRLLKSTHGEWGLLVRWYSTAIPDWARKIVTAVKVPDLAVFSKYSGDWYADADEIHSRIKYIHLMEAGVIVEEAYALRGDQCVGHYMPKSLTTRITKVEDQWTAYDHLFHLGWEGFPRHYEDTIDRVIAEKKAKFNSPEAVEKRERSKARAAAKAALGLND